MSDIYGRRSSSFGGAFTSDDVLLSFPRASENGFEVPMLLQSINITYQQQVSQIYDLTTTNVYYVAGKPAGQGNMQQILGPQKLSRTFIQAYGQVCDAGRHNLAFTMLGSCSTTNYGPRPSGISGGGSWQNAQAFTAQFVVLNSIQIGLQTPNILITNSIGMQFAGLQYIDQSSAASNAA